MDLRCCWKESELPKKCNLKKEVAFNLLAKYRDFILNRCAPRAHASEEASTGEVSKDAAESPKTDIPTTSKISETSEIPTIKVTPATAAIPMTEKAPATGKIPPIEETLTVKEALSTLNVPTKTIVFTSSPNLWRYDIPGVEIWEREEPPVDVVGNKLEPGIEQMNAYLTYLRDQNNDAGIFWHFYETKSLQAPFKPLIHIIMSQDPIDEEEVEGLRKKM